jgi:drug/metabolite transporter (DMT)-like permease
MRWLSVIPIPIVLLVAALLEAGGDAVVRKALHSQALPLRIVLFAAGAALLFAYGTFLNLAPLDFGKVVGLYIATFFLIWQVITYLAFGTVPTLPILLGGTLIVAGGLLVSFWKPQ